MKLNIIYYSRTNTTRKIAEEIGTNLNQNVFEIKDKKNWKGLFGFIKGGYYAVRKKSVDIDYDSKCLEADKIIIMSPVWANVTPPAVAAFINENKDKTFDVLLTCDGSNMENCFKRLDKLYDNLDMKFGIVKSKKNSEVVVNDVLDYYNEYHN